MVRTSDAITEEASGEGISTEGRSTEGVSTEATTLYARSSSAVTTTTWFTAAEGTSTGLDAAAVPSTALSGTHAAAMDSGVLTAATDNEVLALSSTERESALTPHSLTPGARRASCEVLPSMLRVSFDGGARWDLSTSAFEAAAMEQARSPQPGHTHACDPPPDGTAEGMTSYSSEEHRDVGAVSSMVYAHYARATGRGWVCIIVFTLILMQLTSNGLDVWVGLWAASAPGPGLDEEAPPNAPPILLPPSSGRSARALLMRSSSLVINDDIIITPSTNVTADVITQPSPLLSSSLHDNDDHSAVATPGEQSGVIGDAPRPIMDGAPAHDPRSIHTHCMPSPHEHALTAAITRALALAGDVAGARGGTMTSSAQAATLTSSYGLGTGLGTGAGAGAGVLWVNAYVAPPHARTRSSSVHAHTNTSMPPTATMHRSASTLTTTPHAHAPQQHTTTLTTTSTPHTTVTTSTPHVAMQPSSPPPRAHSDDAQHVTHLLLDHDTQRLVAHQQDNAAQPLPRILQTQLLESWLAGHSARWWLTGMLIGAGANCAATLARAFSFAAGGLRAAAVVHDAALRTVLRAPLGFFHATPSGQVLNRFSSDIASVDDRLPFVLNILLACSVGLGGTIVVVLTSQPLMALLLIPVGGFYLSLQKFYRSTSRELKRLESLARSPVYSGFAESRAGARVLRAHGRIAEETHTCASQVGACVRATFSGLAASQWLALRLQLVCAALVCGLSGCALARVALAKMPPADAAIAALALAYALPLVGVLNDVLSTSAQTEAEAVGLERLMHYSKARIGESTSRLSIDVPDSAVEPQSALSVGLQRSESEADALTRCLRGGLVWRDVRLRYHAGAPFALRGANLSVPSGSHVGIAGRTGSGKSSLVSALFGIVPVIAGSIDAGGVPLRAFAADVVRSAFAVVPQQPLLLPGSVHDNVDPERGRGAAAAVDVLKKVGVWAALLAVSAPSVAPHDAHACDDDADGACEPDAQQRHAHACDASGVSSDADAERRVLAFPLGSDTLSAGQQQLLCLARALLKNASVLVLDECTGSCDADTAARMQALVRKEVLQRGGTVVQVAHRPDALADCDIVYVMSDGVVVESGAPGALLANSESKLRALMGQGTGQQ